MTYHIFLNIDVVLSETKILLFLSLSHVPCHCHMSHVIVTCHSGCRQIKLKEITTHNLWACSFFRYGNCLIMIFSPLEQLNNFCCLPMFTSVCLLHKYALLPAGRGGSLEICLHNGVWTRLHMLRGTSLLCTERNSSHSWSNAERSYTLECMYDFCGHMSSSVCHYSSHRLASLIR